MSKLFIFIASVVAVFFTKTASAQIIDTPIEHFISQPLAKDVLPIRGKVLGVNLEDVKDVIVINKRTAEQTITDSRGLFKINGARGDTITFQVSRYSKDFKIVKKPKDGLNVILIKRKTDSLPANHSQADYDEALKADEELYRILVKDAKLDGKWAY